MSIVMTLRRADPAVVAGLTWEEAVAFAVGFDGTKIVASDDVIPFFTEWHVVHFLSSGTEWDKTLPAGFMLGGQDWVDPQTDEDPYQILSLAEVSAIATHLEALPEETITRRMKDLLSGTRQIYSGPNAAEDIEGCREAFKMVCMFFRQAADRKLVVTKATT
jgi:hypothetical protein